MTVITAIEVNDALKKHGGPGAVPREAVLSSEVDIINVAGVFPLVRIAGELDLLFISLVSIGLLFAITVVMRRSQRAGMALLMLVFSFFSLYNFRNRVLHSTARNRPRLAFASLLSRLGPIRTISYDVAHPEPRLFYGTQYLLQHTVFDRFDSRRGEEPRSDVVISGNNWKQARRLGARFVVSAGGRHNALWVLPGEVQSRLPTISYEGVILGAEPVFGVQESGFHRRERSGGGPARWTTGAATLRVPLDPRDLPQVLEIEAVGPARQGGPNLQVFANGVELWNGRILGVWSRSLSLSQVPLGDSLQIDLKSDTFIPYESTEGSGDRRRLGVMVKGIRLQARARPAAEAYTGVTLGAEPVSGIQETGFHRVEQIGGTPARWTNGAASLQVPLDPANLPQSFEIETAAPGRTGARLQLLANGVELWHQKTPPHAWTQTFSLEQVPMEDELFIELNSDTFVPAESLEGSGDQRRLGVVVKGIRVQARESTEQQPENGSTR
jgi:hypothetical protein